jgi:hypothetical protein
MMLQNQSSQAPVAANQELRLQRSILSSELQELESTRRSLTSQLERPGIEAAERTAVTGQIADINQRIATVDKMLARTQGQLSGSPDVAITTVPPSVIIQKGPPANENLLWILFFSAVLLLPFSIAFARRMWRRTPSATAPIPAALDDRLSRMEQAIEATAIEVERIGEGQRFVTRLLTELEPVRALESARETAPRP